ncbi:MAG: D-3-phosphoglycerate dehydrogenase, partial [uncultured Thermomicrobiales bacterium]
VGQHRERVARRAALGGVAGQDARGVAGRRSGGAAAELRRTLCPPRGRTRLAPQPGSRPHVRPATVAPLRSELAPGPGSLRRRRGGRGRRLRGAAQGATPGGGLAARRAPAPDPAPRPGLPRHPGRRRARAGRPGRGGAADELSGRRRAHLGADPQPPAPAAGAARSSSGAALRLGLLPGGVARAGADGRPARPRRDRAPGRALRAVLRDADDLLGHRPLPRGRGAPRRGVRRLGRPLPSGRHRQPAPAADAGDAGPDRRARVRPDEARGPLRQHGARQDRGARGARRGAPGRADRRRARRLRRGAPAPRRSAARTPRAPGGGRRPDDPLRLAGAVDLGLGLAGGLEQCSALPARRAARAPGV